MPRIEAIYIAEQQGEPQQPVEEITLKAGKGIVGDRNYNQSRWPGQNITFIEAEEIERFSSRHKKITPQATRRNVITRGVRLNDLVNKRFRIGNVNFLGVELCEPCAILGNLLASDTLTAPEVVKAWVNKGGLRADILNDGEIRIGMGIDIQELSKPGND